MASESRSNTVKTHDEILAQIRGLTTGIRDGAAAAEEARTVPRETIDALLSAGITRILVPPRFGGHGLGLETWFEVVREIGKADASHAWCASLMIHHPHYISQFAEDAQRAVWAGGLDIAIAASILPSARVSGLASAQHRAGPPTEMPNNWSHDETDDPLYADRRNKVRSRAVKSSPDDALVRLHDPRPALLY